MSSLQIEPYQHTYPSGFFVFQWITKLRSTFNKSSALDYTQQFWFNSSWACVHLNFFLENGNFCQIHNSVSMPLGYISHL